jgi:ribonuclease HII
MPSSRHERAARNAGYRTIAGLDEAGRGALFGPVFAAAVVLDPARPIRGLDDSKQLDPERRQVLAERIRERSLGWAVAAADAFEIDRINILEASRLSMQRACESLPSRADYLLIDALRLNVAIPQKPLIRGDALCFSIAAASILAKVARDAALCAWDPVFPEYGFARNKGYGTADHLDALRRCGPTPLHRFSFEPVRGALAAGPLHYNCASASDVRSGVMSWTGYPQRSSLSQAPQIELFACP